VRIYFIILNNFNLLVLNVLRYEPPLRTDEIIRVHLLIKILEFFNILGKSLVGLFPSFSKEEIEGWLKGKND